MAEPPRVRRARDPVAEGARLLADAVRALGAGASLPRLAVPGGSAAAVLGPARARLGKAWRRVRLTWVDERCVPFASPDSNRGSAYRAGQLDPDHAPALELPLFLDGESGGEAVARVESGLAEGFDGGLDVVLLGMGEDGHVASLFPGGPATHDARVAFVEASPKPPPRRITLTRPVLESARSTVLVAAGEAKRSALERLVAGDAALPAHGLPGLVLVTDLALRGSA